jgi:uncharacterized protein (TIGR02588 family)
VNQSPGRTPAEWTTLVLSSLVLLAVVALIAVELTSTREPPAPVARIDGAIREVEGAFHVPVMVTNLGDETAAEVQVVATLEVAGTTSEADQVIDFLAGDEEEDLVFVFGDDPADGSLTVEVSGFAEP